LTELAAMDLSKLSNSKFVFYHLLFWVGVWFFFLYFFSYNSNNTYYIYWFSSFLLPVTMITTYFVIYYLIPNFLLTKKYKLFTLYGIYTLVISTYLILITIFSNFIFLTNLEVKNMPPMSRNFVFVLILVYLVVVLVSFVSLLNHNFKTLSRNKMLENEILSTQLQIKDQELQYLKKQIHPHFLFNTLNTIYGLALKQSVRTPEIILKLSNLLDYILYQINKPGVNLNEEVSHIKEYLELEKIRFQDTLIVTFISDKISDEIQIAPMLLIPFVENAFKHGSIIDGFLRVDIEIKIWSDNLSFRIKNSVIKDGSESNHSGIGIENLKKRLNLLYHGNHELKFDQSSNWFEAQLSISKINSTKYV